MWNGKSKKRISAFNFLHKLFITVLSSRSLESLPYTSRIIIFDGDSTLNQIPFVVCPTLCLRLSTSKSVEKSAFKRVLFPELWEPIMDTIWYFLWSSRLVSLAKVSSSSMLHYTLFTRTLNHHQWSVIFI